LKDKEGKTALGLAEDLCKSYEDKSRSFEEKWKAEAIVKLLALQSAMKSIKITT